MCQFFRCGFYYSCHKSPDDRWILFFSLITGLILILGLWFERWLYMLHGHGVEVEAKRNYDLCSTAGKLRPGTSDGLVDFLQMRPYLSDVLSLFWFLESSQPNIACRSVLGRFC